MTYSEQRKFERADALNFLAYSCVDEKDGINTQQGIGRTLNISEGGVLLETDRPLDSTQTIFLTIALKDACPVLNQYLESFYKEPPL
ncbi:MAG: hypothetical protein CVU51_06930 [Deltaproteobacteria bacterium HGW-Deltaproteobacteria-1]|nr:MAG: hypothetical protein CVU51_06930 [Deltaproteobacteria bacterium HGW-Deltaproteobacteria-1]